MKNNIIYVDFKPTKKSNIFSNLIKDFKKLLLTTSEPKQCKVKTLKVKSS